jgi:hypothetical protein
MKQSWMILLVLALAACATPTEDAPAADPLPELTTINSHCPMLGMPVEEVYTVEYKGHHIGLCCARCKQGFNQMTDGEKDELLAEAMHG